MMTETIGKRRWKGYLLGMAAGVSYGMNPLFTLPLYEDGMNADSVLFFRYLFGIVILGLMLVVRRPEGEPIRRRQWLPLMVYGVLMALSSLTLFLSYNYMAAGIASTILFVYPVVVALVMTFFFHEKLTLRTMVCILTAIVGVLLLYKQSDGATLSLAGVLLSLTSAVTYALYLIGINRHGLKQIPTLKVTFFVLLFGWAIFLIRALYQGGLVLPTAEHWYLWGCLIALGVVPTAVSFLCTTAAIQHVGSTPTAILGVLEPATAVFFGVTVFGERLTVREWVGLMFIMVAVVLVVAGGKITQPLTRFRHLFPKGRKADK